MRLPANLDRDYYREGIKYLVQFDKPFFVVREYQLPSTPSEAIFSCFRCIFPVIYSAKSIMLCDHIHVARGLCEKYYCSRRVKFAKLRRSKNANSGRLKFANLSQSKRANHKISTAQIGCSGYG